MILTIGLIYVVTQPFGSKRDNFFLVIAGIVLQPSSFNLPRLAHCFKQLSNSSSTCIHFYQLFKPFRCLETGLRPVLFFFEINFQSWRRCITFRNARWNSFSLFRILSSRVFLGVPPNNWSTYFIRVFDEKLMFKMMPSFEGS